MVLRELHGSRGEDAAILQILWPRCRSCCAASFSLSVWPALISPLGPWSLTNASLPIVVPSLADHTSTCRRLLLANQPRRGEPRMGSSVLRAPQPRRMKWLEMRRDLEAVKEASSPPRLEAADAWAGADCRAQWTWLQSASSCRGASKGGHCCWTVACRLSSIMLYTWLSSRGRWLHFGSAVSKLKSPWHGIYLCSMDPLDWILEESPSHELLTNVLQLAQNNNLYLSLLLQLYFWF
jgi:hypothetical protein